MSDDKTEKPSIFSKIMQASNAVLDAQIHKAKSSITMNSDVTDDEDFVFSKAVTEDPSYQIHSQGFKEKPHRIQNSHLKQISYHDQIIANIIQTRQNQVAKHATLVESEQKHGFMVVLDNEKEELEKIKEELKAKRQAENSEVEAEAMTKADPPENEKSTDQIDSEQQGADDDDNEEFDWELHRQAKAILDKKYADGKKAVEQYILNCGKEEKRPFESKKWNFESALRAWVRDSLTYDLYATEVVPDKIGRPHYWFPVDGSTTRFASASLKKYKDLNAYNFTNTDLLYPENNPKIRDAKDKKLDLDDKLLEANAYKYVQVVRGKVERAYTTDELKVGIRNVNTDIYNNGYGIAELELSVTMVTNHLNAEYYNANYFQQGFAAKGILHIKKALNRRKLETVRQQWQHMIKGTRNAFQTPIFAGVEDVKWIPLTQNHNDIGFEGWMRYLVKMMCGIYQIDPHEVGLGLKDEGQGGGGMSGDNTKEKLSEAKDRGLYPLMSHIEHYVNSNIIKPFDKRFKIKFCGITEESKKEALERQKEEAKFKKTVNEIRAEDGLPPLPGMDNFIIDPTYMQWFATFSKEGKEINEQNMQAQMQQPGMGGENPEEEEVEPFYEDDFMDTEPPQEVEKSQKIRKSRPIKVEYYRTGED